MEPGIPIVNEETLLAALLMAATLALLWKLGSGPRPNAPGLFVVWLSSDEVARLEMIADHLDRCGSEIGSTTLRQIVARAKGDGPRGG